MKRVFSIPMRLTLLIDVEMDSDIPEADTGGGVQVVSIDQEKYAAELMRLCEQVKEVPEFDDAIDNLCAAIHMHRRKYPTTKAYLATFAGLTEEVEL